MNSPYSYTDDQRDELVKSLNEVLRVAELVSETQPIWSAHLKRVWAAGLQFVPPNSDECRRTQKCQKRSQPQSGEGS
jgi:hypothetical protein